MAKINYLLKDRSGQVVYFVDPALVYSFSIKFLFEKNANKQKEAGVGPF